MVVECLAIIAIIGAIAFGYLRAGKKEYAAVIATLLLLPGAHLILELFSKALLRLQGGEALWVVMDSLAMAITCLLIGRLSRFIPGRGQRSGMLCITCAYSVLLAVIFIFDIVGG